MSHVSKRLHVLSFISTLVLGIWLLLPSHQSHAAGISYYVATNGSDSNSCAEARNRSTPERTIEAGAECLSGGDILQIRSGTYNEGELLNIVPSELSASQPTIIQGDSGEANRRRIRPTSSKNYIIMMGVSGRQMVTAIKCITTSLLSIQVLARDSRETRILFLTIRSMVMAEPPISQNGRASSETTSETPTPCPSAAVGLTRRTPQVHTISAFLWTPFVLSTAIPAWWTQKKATSASNLALPPSTPAPRKSAPHPTSPPAATQPRSCSQTSSAPHLILALVSSTHLLLHHAFPPPQEAPQPPLSPCPPPLPRSPWTVTNATTYTASGSWSGSKSAQGGTQQLVVSQSSTYTLTCTGPGGTAQDSVTVTLGSSSPCVRYQSGSSIPSGFGVPWDVTSPRTLLLNATCTSPTVVLSVGIPNTAKTIYIYKTAYIAPAGSSSWSPVDLFGSGLVSNAWYRSYAQGTATLETTNPGYYRSYTCVYTTRWLCGYRDSACTQSYWQIQRLQQ